MGKFAITDFGRIVKPKVLLTAHMMCKHESFDVDRWWRQARINHDASPHYKRDIISGTYGMKPQELFSDLPLKTYIGQIVSFLVLHRGSYKLVSSLDDIAHLRTGNRITICAIGVKFYLSYDSVTKTLGEPWKPTAEEHLHWFFTPKQLIPFELVEQYNTAEVGDLVVYTKSHGMVASVTTVKRRRFYAVCSWTDKKITVVSGQSLKYYKLSVERPYYLVKKKEENS
jgi:hypothetical protein